MTDDRALKGDLQAELMRVLWALGGGTVEDVRSHLPDTHRGAYTTIQTVLNRLAERGLLERERRGKALVYRPLLSEAEYASASIRVALDSVSSGARAAALAQLIGSLDDAELEALRRESGQIRRQPGS